MRSSATPNGRCSKNTPESSADIATAVRSDGLSALEAAAASLPERPYFRRDWTARADRAVGALVEPLAAALIAIELLLMAAGVIARYVLHSPLPWSDELALILFLWLTMLGAVVAYRKDEHMRLTMVVRRAHVRCDARRDRVDRRGAVLRRPIARRMEFRERGPFRSHRRDAVAAHV
jgi:hypothetical protein